MPFFYFAKQFCGNSKFLLLIRKCTLIVFYTYLRRSVRYKDLQTSKRWKHRTMGDASLIIRTANIFQLFFSIYSLAFFSKSIQSKWVITSSKEIFERINFCEIYYCKSVVLKKEFATFIYANTKLILHFAEFIFANGKLSIKFWGQSIWKNQFTKIKSLK